MIRSELLAITLCGSLCSCRAFFMRSLRLRVNAPRSTLNSRMLASSVSDQASTDANIIVKNTQRKHAINSNEIITSTSRIMQLLEVPGFEVSIWFCSDSKIREFNADFRQQRRATDVLSFPMIEFTTPGKLPSTHPMLSEKYLGDIMIAPNYVHRQCLRDKAYLDKHGTLDTAGDRGVSAAMASTFELQERLPLLLVHSLCHLMGFDHETDEDWEKMAEEEERILRALSDQQSLSVRN